MFTHRQLTERAPAYPHGHAKTDQRVQRATGDPRLEEVDREVVAAGYLVLLALLTLLIVGTCVLVAMG